MSAAGDGLTEPSLDFLSPFRCTNKETSFVNQDKRGFLLEQILPLWYDQFGKLEFDGMGRQPMRYGLRPSNHTIGSTRLVAMIRSAYGIRQT